MINFSQAAENNKMPILQQLRDQLPSTATVLEVGSGAGQHALYFASQLAYLTWQPSDQGDYLAGLKANIQNAAMSNVREPIYLDLNNPNWPVHVDCLYAANVVHIMPARLLPTLFENPADTLLLYGPYKYNGDFTSQSNADFDIWLKDRNPLSGIRDIESLLALADRNHYRLDSDTNMPANNQFLVFKRSR